MKMKNPRPNVCLVDDDATVRAAFKVLMKSAGLTLVSFASAEEFLEEYQDKNIGCLVLDLRMPGMSGAELHEYLVKNNIPIPVIILSGHADIPLAVQAIKQGAVNVLEKPFREEAVLQTVRRALDMKEHMDQVSKASASIAERMALLTPREREVMELMCTGKSNRNIAAELGISPKTLDIHRAKVMGKMEADTVADLVNWRFYDRIHAFQNSPAVAN